MKKNDFILAVAIILIAVVVFLFIPKDKGNIAKITVNGKLYATVSLDKNQKVEINDTNVCVVENGEIYMESATCPDKLCVHQGRISDNSKKIVCLPNKVIIEVFKDSELDSVVR